jgi:lipoate-protein ligase A
MGKNQNPWRELHLEEVRAENVPLARRISGGGTVYHDPGNLNLSWILPREDYDANRIHGVFLQVLEDLGLKGTPGVSGGLRVNGKKISGAAFCYRQNFVLHHGTLLLSADLTRMRQLLSPPRLQIDTHAVRSIPASVANLTDFIPGLDPQEVISLFRRHTERMFGPLEEATGLIPDEERTLQADVFRSPDWIWDQTPAFTVSVDLKKALPVSFKVRKGTASGWQLNGEERPDIPPAPFRQASIPGWAAALEQPPEALRTALTSAGWHLPAQ